MEFAIVLRDWKVILALDVQNLPDQSMNASLIPTVRMTSHVPIITARAHVIRPPVRRMPYATWNITVRIQNWKYHFYL